jgi:hypothetical protein
MSFPDNYSTTFKSKEIKLVFDEYIKLKNLNKQLVISLKYEPLITPLTATKYLTIKIKILLAPNTTYSFNFGQSIADNNEGNPLNQFKYVFSTGSLILFAGGRVKDAIEELDPLYRFSYAVNEHFTVRVFKTLLRSRT